MALEKAIAQAVVQEVMTVLRPLLAQKSENRMYSGTELAEKLGVSKKTLERMRKAGLMAYQPMGSEYYYYENDVDNFIKRKGRAI